MQKPNEWREQRRKILILAASSACFGSVAFAQSAKDYPSKPIRIIVPFAAGGSVDLLARTIGKKLSDRLGQPIVVENRPGGGTLIGTDTVAKSPSDGYTLLLAVSTHTSNPALYEKLPYDSVKDFQAVSILARPSIVLYANPDFPVKNLKELIAYAGKMPDGVNYGSGGVGIMSHLAAEQFRELTGLAMTHIVYKGGTPALNDTMAGHIPLFFGTVTQGLSAYQAKRVVALGVMAEHRQAAMPDVPTFREQGIDMVAADWYGMIAPSGTPVDVIQKLNAELRQIMNLPDVKDLLSTLGITSSTPKEMDEMLKLETARWGDLIKKLGIKAG